MNININRAVLYRMGVPESIQLLSDMDRWRILARGLNVGVAHKKH